MTFPLNWTGKNQDSMTFQTLIAGTGRPMYIKAASFHRLLEIGMPSQKLLFVPLLLQLTCFSGES